MFNPIHGRGVILPWRFEIFLALLNRYTYSFETFWLFLKIKNQNFEKNQIQIFYPIPHGGGCLQMKLVEIGRRALTLIDSSYIPYFILFTPSFYYVKPCSILVTKYLLHYTTYLTLLSNSSLRPLTRSWLYFCLGQWQQWQQPSPKFRERNSTRG